MNTIRVIAGELKGRAIPFTNRKYGNADITPQKVKGAIFSSIGPAIIGKGFLDLYGCSGQVGIEALSRGASPVIINELERRCFSFIDSFVSGLDLKRKPILLNLPALKAVKHLKENGTVVAYIYIDPPYRKTSGQVDLYNEVVTVIGESGILEPSGLLIIQHYSKNSVPPDIGSFSQIKTSRYGTTAVSFFGMISGRETA